MVIDEILTGRKSTTSPSRPVVGADRSTATIAASLARGRSVIVAGTLGSGKSYLVDAVAHALAMDGRSTTIVRAAGPLTSTPFGALRSNDVVAALLDRPAGEAPSSTIVLIDDGHLLDTDSTRWISREIHARRLTTLVVGAPSSSPESRRADPQTLSEIDELWLSGRAERIDLRPLTFREAEDLIRQEVGPGIIDRIRRVDLFKASGGSRLFLLEMARDLAGRNDREVDRAPITTRIRDVLRYQLGDLSRSERLCVALVSRLGGITRPRIARVLDARAAERLLEKGHLATDARTPDMLRASSIFATFLETSGELDEVERLVDALAQILPPDAVLSSVESADLATRWSFDGQLASAVDHHGADLVRRTILVASTEAFEHGRFRDALDLARKADSIGPTADAQVAVSRALSGLRRDEEALDALAGAVPLLRDDAEALRLFQWWTSLLIGLGNYEDLDPLYAEAGGWPASGPMVRGEIRAARLQTAYAFMQWEDVETEGLDIANDAQCALSTRVRAAVEAATALIYRGDVPGALRTLRLARRINTDPVSGAAIDEIAHISILTGDALVRFTSGAGFCDLLTEAEAVLTRESDRATPAALGFLGYVGAVADIFRGDLRAADHEYRAAVARFTTAESSGWRSGIHSEHALVLALLGDPSAATEALRQAEDLAAERSPLTRHLFTRAQLVTSAQSGSGDTAALARELLTLSSESPGLRAVDLYLVLLFGEGSPDDREALRHLTASLDFPLGRLLERHLTAREGGDPKELERVAADSATAGTYLLALHAQRDAVEAYEREGNALRLAQSRRQLDDYGTLSRRANSVSADPTVARLSDRERQVAAFVAQGLSNREIADRLFLSVRTVESHIYQARLKLGATSRRGIGDVLDLAAWSQPG